MITRAVVVEVDYSINKIKVRIPSIDGAENSQQSISNEDLNWASIMWIPGISVDYQPGDIVIVGFEDNDTGKPVVLGYLKLKDSAISESKLYCKVSTMEIQKQLTAPVDTVIGKVSHNQLYNSCNK